MFRGWGFLLGEIWVLLALAALLGLVIGWLIWGRRAPDSAAAEGLRAELRACQARGQEAAQKISRLEAELRAVPAAPVTYAAKAAPAAPAAQAPAPTAEPVASVGTKPAALRAPRGGKADDLKRIKGIGPKLEQLCNRLGFWHFDQIAAWSAEEIAWVDANLETFKGRVTRDDWVAQARALMKK